jgi:hypothetical protein
MDIEMRACLISHVCDPEITIQAIEGGCSGGATLPCMFIFCAGGGRIYGDAYSHLQSTSEVENVDLTALLTQSLVLFEQ